VCDTKGICDSCEGYAELVEKSTGYYSLYLCVECYSEYGIRN